MGQNRYMQDHRQLRQQDNGARQRKQPDEFKFRVGGRIRGVPLIVRFNYRIRQHEGDQAYKNDDLESFVGHDRVDRTTQPSGMQVAWLHAQCRRILTFSISVFTSIEFLRCGHPSAISTRFRTNESVVNELLPLKARACAEKGQIAVFFIDDNFAINVKRTKSLLRDVIADGAQVHWVAQISANLSISVREYYS